jgi:hypothetical protein
MFRRKELPPKRWQLSTRLHEVTTQKAVMFVCVVPLSLTRPLENHSEAITVISVAQHVMWGFLRM